MRRRILAIFIVCVIALIAAIMVIMPAAATTTTFSPDRDVNVDEEAPDANCDDAHITMPVWGVPDMKKHALIHFDLSSIPSGATIDSATLHLFIYQNIGGTDKTNNIHRITASWTETGVTWNSRDGTTDWDTSGGDYVSTVTAGTSTGTMADVWVEWDVKTDVQAFVDDTYTNYGWLIKYETEGGMDGVDYYTREYTEADKRPKLEVTYTPAATPTPGPGPTGVPEFSPLGLIALIGVLSVLLAGTTIGRGKRRQ